MPDVRAPAGNLTTTSDEGGLLVMRYDAAGTKTVDVFNWPLIGWVFDPTAPANPKPVTIGDPLGTNPAPSTGTIKSPQWALAITNNAVYVPNEDWRGTLGEFCTWLALNNGAQRTVACYFTMPMLANAYAQWARDYPSLATRPTQLPG
jgi:hypothetical protein